MTNWLKQNSGGSGNPAVAFEAIGATIVGRITDEPRVVESEFEGKTSESLVIDLEVMPGTNIRAGKVDERDVVQPGATVSVWLKAGAMARAVMEACRKAGTEGLAEGGILALQYTANGERKPGKNPPKLYAAEYQKPTPVVAVGGSLLGGASDQTSSF
jgi:hypothetical protein